MRGEAIKSLVDGADADGHFSSITNLSGLCASAMRLEVLGVSKVVAADDGAVAIRLTLLLADDSEHVHVFATLVDGIISVAARLLGSGLTSVCSLIDGGAMRGMVKISAIIVLE